MSGALWDSALDLVAGLESTSRIQSLRHHYQYISCEGRLPRNLLSLIADRCFMITEFRWDDLNINGCEAATNMASCWRRNRKSDPDAAWRARDKVRL